MKFHWDQQTILLTGGTGSFGQSFTHLMLTHYRPKALRIFSRDEWKQSEMAKKFPQENLRFFLGDVRDKDRLRRAMDGVTVVVHAAALKQVPLCEYNPFEAIQTNVVGAQNIIDAAIDAKVDRVMALSTDKAVNPVNLYGASKLCGEKLFVQGNFYAGGGNTRFSCVRYGNVIGSRGSVLPLFKEQMKTKKITITDKDMTRFWISLKQGVSFVIHCIEFMQGSEIFVPKIPSMKIVEMAKAVAPGCQIRLIGIRPGEKVHEVLLSEDEGRESLDAGSFYVIQPKHLWRTVKRWRQAKELPPGFRYASDSNTQWLNAKQLRSLLLEGV